MKGKHLHYREAPERCVCEHATGTPEWHGKRRSGGGLYGRSSWHFSECVHSELARTSVRTKRPRTVPRVVLA